VAHTRRRRVLHGLCISLARDASVIAFARKLAVGSTPQVEDARIPRVTTVFTFVAHLVDARPGGTAPADLGALRPLLAFREGPAVLLCALLNALGERARLERTREMAFVRVALDIDDVGHLPPHVRLLGDAAHPELPLDPRQARTPLGFLPRAVCSVLARRGAAARR
jgi:hypothetical protein